MHAVIFDFDGLVLDTELPRLRAWQEIYQQYGCTLEDADWQHIIGTADHFDPYALLCQRATCQLPSEDEVRATKTARELELIHAERTLPGVLEWLDDAERLDLGVAIASTSPADWVEGHLERLGLRHRFAVISCYAEPLRPKPAPDVYLAALEALGVGPSDAVAAEDSPHGIAAAKAAGLFCVAVPNQLTGPLDLSAADVVVPSLADLPLAALVDRFAS